MFYDSRYEIIDIDILSNNKAILYTKCTKEKKPVNEKGNCILYALILAKARLFMFQQMNVFQQRGCSIYSASTDCIAFSSPSRNIEELFTFELGPNIGKFRPEFKNIVSFSSLAPRNYCLSYKNEGTEVNLYRICGLSVTNAVQGDLDSGVYYDLVKKFIQNEYAEYKLSQQKLVGSTSGALSCGQIAKRETQFLLRNMLFKNRIPFGVGNRMITLPYGFPELKRAHSGENNCSDNE